MSALTRCWQPAGYSGPDSYWIVLSHEKARVLRDALRDAIAQNRSIIETSSPPYTDEQRDVVRDYTAWLKLIGQLYNELFPRKAKRRRAMGV